MSKADEIKKFKDLLDSGAITPEEYERAKNDILSKPKNYAPSKKANSHVYYDETEPLEGSNRFTEANENTHFADNQKRDFDPQTQAVKKRISRNKKLKRALLVIVAVLILFLIIGLVSAPKLDPEIKLIMNATGADKDQAARINQVFDACGFDEIKVIEKIQSGPNMTSYHVRDESTQQYNGMVNNATVWIMNDSKDVNAVYFNTPSEDYDIYVEGAYSASVKDYYVPEECISAYRADIQLALETVLSYPDSLKLPSRSDWVSYVTDGYDVLEAKFTAKNAFGVDTTMTLTAKFIRDSETMTSLVVDGIEYVN